MPSAVSVTADTYPAEVSWELTCGGLSAPVSGGSPYSETHAVPPGTCTLVLMDAYGDGWQGATWTAPGWTDQSFTLTSENSQPTPSPNASGPPPSPTPPPDYNYDTSFSGPVSRNVSFDVSFQPPSPPSPPLPPPSMPAHPSEISVTEDTYNYEVTWQLTCDGLSTPVTGGSPYSETHAVSPGTCTLHLMDAYGDGWQGATWTAPGWTDQSFTLASGSSDTVSFYAGPEPPSPPTPSRCHPGMPPRSSRRRYPLRRSRPLPTSRTRPETEW